MKNTDDKRPRGVGDVKNIEVSESHIKPRAIFAAVFLVIGIAAIGIFVHSMLTTEPGWQTVELNLSEPSAADEFTLTYLFGTGEMSPAAENKLIESVYADACQKAYKLFDSELLFDGVSNVAYINAHINEEISVDPVLYDAFSKIEAYGSRYLYLAPVYGEYDAAFFGIEMPSAAAELDPYVNLEFAQELSTLAEYAASPEHISLNLLGDSKIMLSVSEEYLEFAKEYGITSYIDFYRTKNAFIIDYLAQVLQENGFGCATITSYDGYTRNLDVRGDEYVFNIFDRVGGEVYRAAELYYTAPRAVVSFRDYPASERESYNYYMYGDRIISPFIDTADGLYRCAVSSLTAYSGHMGCADVLLRVLPVYISDAVDAEALESLADDKIYSVWCEDSVIYSTDEKARIEGIYSDEERGYTLAHADS